MSKNSYKSTHIAIKSTPKTLLPLNVDGHEIAISDKHNHAFIQDAGLAKELSARHGAGKEGEISKDVVVSPVNLVTETHHNYFFGSMPEMPWKKKKEQNEKAECTE
jgi:hypothetical protein